MAGPAWSHSGKSCQCVSFLLFLYPRPAVCLSDITRLKLSTPSSCSAVSWDENSKNNSFVFSLAQSAAICTRHQYTLGFWVKWEWLDIPQPPTCSLKVCLSGLVRSPMCKTVALQLIVPLIITDTCIFLFWDPCRMGARALHWFRLVQMAGLGEVARVHTFGLMIFR